MKKLFKTSAILLSVFLFACESEEEITTGIIAGDFSVKEYALERDPNVNVWGAGMDFIHLETKNSETSLDYRYLEEVDDFSYDIKFFIVKSYYTNSKGEIASEGCPTMLLAPGVMGCKIGEGVAFFDTCSVIAPEIVLQLKADPEIDFDACKNEAGYYDRELLFEAIAPCVIGRSFRSNVLIVPEGMTEQEIQPVYLIKTREGGYAKFMVKQFKGAKPNEKQTIVRWQVIRE